MFIRYDLSEPPPVGLVLQRLGAAERTPRVIGLDARRGFAVGDIDFCAADGHSELIAIPGDTAARPEVRVFSTPRDEVRQSAGRWAGQQPAILCAECQDSYRSCVRDGRPRCRQRFVRCRRRLDLDDSCQP